MTLPELINTLVGIRKDQGISQTEMAERIGITQGAISHLELNRDNSTSLRAAIPYADALGYRITFGLEIAPKHNETQSGHNETQNAAEQKKQATDDTTKQKKS